MQYQDVPRDDEAEKAILSIILSNPDRLIEVIDLLSPLDFWIISHQQIWTAIIEVFRAGHDLDIVSIRNQLKKSEVDVQPALTALSEAFNSEALDTNLFNFIKQVQNKSRLRKIIQTISNHSTAAYLENADASKVLNGIEKDILKISDTLIESKPINAEGIIHEVNADLAQSQERGWQGYQTGFVKLDSLTGGLIPTQSWIIGAYTGIGKSFFILQILLNVLRQGGKVVLFSTEMDRKINMLRLIGNIAEVGTINLMRGSLTEGEKIRVEKAKQELSSFKDNLIIYDNVYDLAELRLKSKKIKITNGLNIIAVDFIQNLRGKESLYERMSEAAVGLQQLAQELGVTMIIGSQVSQAAAGSYNKEAIEFKGAGEIAAIADVALWLSKPKNNSDESLRQVMIRKVRHGAPGWFEVKLTFPAGKVVDMEAGKLMYG